MQSRKSKGIIRNRTDLLRQFKDNRRKKTSRFAKQSLFGAEDGFSAPAPLKKPLMQIEMIPTMAELPPEWVDQYEDCLSLIQQIDETRKQIFVEQRKRLNTLKVSEERESDRRIFDLTTSATTNIRKCEKIISAIKTIGETGSPADRQTCRNVHVGLAVTLQEKTRELRAKQRAFVEQRKEIEDRTKVSFLQLAASKMYDEDQSYEDNDHNLLEGELELRMQESRNEEILNIIQSIHELNDLYKELNSLVIVQGSLLDRIDCNIEESAGFVKKGGETIQRVDQRQRKSKCACGFMAFLAIAIAILGIILIVRWTR